MEHLAGVDSFWLRMEKPNNRMTITGVVRFAGPVSLAAVKELWHRQLLRFRRFHQIPRGHHSILGRPHWEDDPHFDIDRHVFHVTLPEGDEAALKRLMNDLMTEQLEESKPLWTTHLVDGVGEGSAMIVRVHHSLADGFSMIFLMLSLVDEDCEVKLPGHINLPSVTPDPRSDDPEHHGRLHRARETAQQLITGGIKALRHPNQQSEPLREAAQCAGRLFAMPADSPTVMRGTLGRRKIGTWSNRIPLQAIKDAAQEIGGTVNDVLMGALAGAFRRYLEGRDQPVAGLDVRAVVPVNIRPFERRTDDLGNGFGLVFLELPAGLETSQARMKALKARMDDIKGSPEAFLTYGLMHSVGMMPNFLQEQLVKLFEGKSTAIVTNVPGPMEPVRMLGQIVDDIIFYVPQSAGAGVGISIFSYNGSVRLGVATDASLIPDPQAIVDAYHAELKSLGVELSH